MLGAARRFRHIAFAAGRLPVLGAVVSEAYRKLHFNVAQGRRVRLFHGIFPDFASAERAIPASWNSGYDNEASAYRVSDELDVYAYDYPVMFWLEKMLPACSLLFDWGGNIGLKYYAYQKYLAYPASMTWLVSDVPAVVALGEKTARIKGAEQLRFTTRLDEVANADILLVSGALHFIEDPFGRLRALPNLPNTVILNKVPACSAPSAWTLHNMGTAMCPYHLFNRAELVRSTEELGYRLIDEWKNPDLACCIPFSPTYAIDVYSGYTFRETRLNGPRDERTRNICYGSPDRRYPEREKSGRSASGTRFKVLRKQTSREVAHPSRKRCVAVAAAGWRSPPRSSRFTDDARRVLRASRDP